MKKGIIYLFVSFLGAMTIISSCKSKETLSEREPEEVTLNEVESEEPSKEETTYEVIVDSKVDEVEVIEEVDVETKTRPAMMDMASTAMMRSEAAVATKVGRPGGVANLPSAGQITAGEWNDLHNWSDWLELIKEDDYVQMQSYWGIYPENRITVYIKNKDHAPVVGARVELVGGDEKVLWETLSDQSGHAELWPASLTKSKVTNYQIKVTYDKEEYLIGDVKMIDKGTNDITLPVRCEQPKEVDIMFVVDATGSMGDEIMFLQSELKDVLSRAAELNRALTFRTGAVFYRDHQDDYLTQISELTTDPSETINFISNQNAAGGGDYPEAVEAGLADAINQDWSENALTKIIFLLLDAPPHKDSTSMQMIKQSISDAAEMGIKIIPISASGINRETEFLMKYMAILTNGTYVFITDDSGIGNAHLDPVVQDYEVEKLNDLLVRLLTNYTQEEYCNIDHTTKANTDIMVYPNPTSNLVNVTSKEVIQRVEILSSSGQILIKQDANGDRDVRIDLANLIDGMYQVRIVGDDYEETRKVIKVSG